MNSRKMRPRIAQCNCLEIWRGSTPNNCSRLVSRKEFMAAGHTMTRVHVLITIRIAAAQTHRAQVDSVVLVQSRLVNLWKM